MVQKWIIDYCETMDVQRGEQSPNVMLIWNSENPTLRMYGRASSYHPDDYPKAFREFMQQDLEFRKWIKGNINDDDILVFTDIPGEFNIEAICTAIHE